MIDPTNSKGGEMVIPYHYYKNNSDVQIGELAALGQLWIRSFNLLKHANGGTTPISVTVFAWAEEVELSVLTSMDLAGLTPQAGDETDEANMKGIVSGPATTISKAAGKLATLPVIGPYATATSQAASITAEIASAFGYCKPAVTKAPEPYRPTPISSLALTNVPDVTQKLSVDHKQELTIDPTIVGYGEGDPLDIKSIASRESYFTQFDWDIGQSTDTLLFNVRVDPVTWLPDSSGYYFPACTAAAMPFKYWSGTMNYRFQFVCSAFHKGRVKIVYDPFQSDDDQYNVNYMRIVDLAEEQDVTVSVGMGQTTTLRDHILPGTNPLSFSYSTTTKLSRSLLVGNGVLAVYVVNDLTAVAPTIDNDITVNVFVSAGDDFEVYVPDDYFQQFVFQEQSGFESQAGDEPMMTTMNDTAPLAVGNSAEELDHPVSQVPKSLAVNYVNDNKTPLVFAGESISSFRTMLKRYNRWLSISPLGGISTEIILSANAFPLLRGNVNGAVHTTGAAAPYNYVNTTLMHWVTYMFSGFRGAIRYKLIPRAQIGEQTWMVSRNSNNGIGGYSLSVGAPNTLTTQKEAAWQTVYEEGNLQAQMSGVEGCAYTTSAVNPVLEWEMPFYSNMRFVPGKIQNWTIASDFIESFTLYGTVTTGGDDSWNELWVAAGEDYQTYIFTGLPVMYFEANPPNP
jgi:hypothetical protein